LSVNRRWAISLVLQVAQPNLYLIVSNAEVMTAFGTKRTCRGRLTISAPEGKTDVPREPGHFRF
jgi:hypothetical protein